MVELPPHLRKGLTDSAGQPWEGRTFSDNPWQDDDGSAPADLSQALRGFRSGELPPNAVVEALRDTRLLIPLVAELGEAGVNEAGVTVDKSADLSIVTVRSPDGRGIVPVFSSVAAMKRWDSKARPVPADSRRTALAAVDEGSDLLILDPGSPETEFVVRRPMVWAIARDTPYELPWQDSPVLEKASALMASEPRILGIDLSAGDPGGTFAGPELLVSIALDAALPEVDEQAVLQVVQRELSHAAEFVERVDSLGLRVLRIDKDAQPAPEERAPRGGLFRRRRKR